MFENTITFTVPWFPMLVGVGVATVVFGIRGQVRRVNARSLQRRQKIQDEFQSLFPSPWDEAHKELKRIHWKYYDPNARARNFLRHWLSEQKKLPCLSRKAVCEIVCMLTFEYCSKWDECLSILDPYTDEIQSLAKTERLERTEAGERTWDDSRDSHVR